MFSAEDAKEVFQLHSSEGDVSNPLILSSSGDGFVTRKHVHQAFENLATKVYATQRVYLSSLARDLDVDVDTVRTLVDGYDGTLVLRSGKGLEIITKAQRDAINQELQHGIATSVVSKTEFASKHDLSHKSLENLINLSEMRTVEVDGYLFSTSYYTTALDAVAELLRDHLQSLQAIDLSSTNVPGSPPAWFIHRIVKNLLEDPEFIRKFYVEKKLDGVQCTPVQLVKRKHDTVIDNLRLGQIAYLDLHSFQRESQALYSSLEEAQRQLESTQDVDVQGTFALSQAWISKFSEDCLQGLARDNGVEIGHLLRARFPNVLHTIVLDKVEQAIRALSPEIHRVGDCILNESGYSYDRSALLDLAKADAASQWQQLKESPRIDVKYSLSNITSQIPTNRPTLQNLIKERTIERAVEDAFSAELLELEKQNEDEFAEFWTDRVATRTAIYTEGLSAVEDQKLQDQLSELLAQYVQKDLVPDAVSKSSSQGFVLSRKTRKNVLKLESALSAGSMDVSALTTSLDRFNKKQSINAPTTSALEMSKETMLSDMARRMQKQKKSDGPLLFLTLVVFLFAKHNAGILYATGKFAPKLLKQLKSTLDAGQYELLEAWKESAKAGTLSAEDRDAMKKMVEARL
ncbi:uncharacterized protein EKO05_0004535 [Ascochyta rabiei]|uniref:E3 UFM1-protein ligase 1-like N-terminal domain-containing protein n=1 Tax=Didymella rabiei TaxID=5454 RepID=A0A162ZB19_DIDRA|nr:uncharacterized protein EKO05_0004535 [Ascochyta rabiei]KZM20508.1 hypothetical protein ST47_g8377 [Ascochyta rabiei]UPX14043.1 hypothetical protein EKO05_0004535 [Ascochyta rabiei]